LNINTQHTNLLHTENLDIGYQQKDTKLLIANNLRLGAKKGELIAILGKNGSGKSTLLRTLANIQKPLHGSIYINDKNINHYPTTNLAQNLSVVFTEKLPTGLLRVEELISMGRQVHTNWLDTITNKDRDKINFAVELTNTFELLPKLFDELSDGQKQKVLIARAIAQDTALLFLDEPTAHLDIHHRMESFLLLQKLAHTYQKTVIIATHEIGLAIKLADKIWLLNNKEIQVGKPNDLIDKAAISKVFDSDLIRFNPKKSSFEYK